MKLIKMGTEGGYTWYEAVSEYEPPKEDPEQLKILQDLIKQTEELLEDMKKTRGKNG